MSETQAHPLRKLRHLLLVTPVDPFNPASWSGIPWSMRTSLERHVERLSVLSVLRPKRTLRHGLLRLILGADRYPLYLTRPALKENARLTAEAIRREQPDAVLSISTHCLLDLEPQPVPVFTFSDAPWIAWKKTYSAFEPTPLTGPRFARLEAEAARRATALFFSSHWAAREAQQLYGVPRDRIHVYPMGANSTPDLTTAQLDAVLSARPTDRLDLLYVGRDWARKGGPLAIDIALALTRAGVPNVRLHIAGCTPPIPPEARALVKVHGLLSRSHPDQANLLRDLFLNSHFLVVPTLAECFGLVFSESLAFGLPPIARAVQAVPEIVADGETGIVEPRDAPADAYVARILPLLKDRARYQTMARTARRSYEEKFSWDHFAKGIATTINQYL